MKETAEYFERLLWFVYRVLFTLLPSALFAFITIAFLYNFNLINLETISETFEKLGFAKWLILLASIFCLNLMLESFTNFLVSRIFIFRKLSQDQYSKDKALINLLTTYNPKVLELLNSNHSRITLGAALFNFGLAQGNQSSIWFNNYVWFLISREFLFSNFSISILLASILFFPFCIFKYYALDIWFLVIMEILQIFIVAAIIYFTKKLLIIDYPSNEVEGDKYYSTYSKKNIRMLIPSTLLFVVSILLFPFEQAIPFAVFILISSVLFLIPPLLFLRALREFIHVEYLIMTFFAKNNYDNLLISKKSAV